MKRGVTSVVGHSVVGLLARLADRHPALAPLNDDDLAAELDLYHVAARYPNGLAEGVPHQALTRTQAERALEAVSAIPTAVKGALPS